MSLKYLISLSLSNWCEMLFLSKACILVALEKFFVEFQPSRESSVTLQSYLLVQPTVRLGGRVAFSTQIEIRHEMVCWIWEIGAYRTHRPRLWAQVLPVEMTDFGSHFTALAFTCYKRNFRIIHISCVTLSFPDIEQGEHGWSGYLYM